MTAEIINLRQARKRLDRERKEAQAAENRLAHGRSKIERELEERRRGLDRTRLDGQKRETPGDETA